MPRQITPPLSLAGWLRFDLIKAELERAAPTTVLEVGAGRGAMGSWLASQYDYAGVEPDADSRSAAQARLAEVGRGTVAASLHDISETGFDAVCSFEVLEHIDDDAGALRTWRERLRPGGVLVLSVPAFQDRFGPTDELVGHYRRYEPDALRELLHACGFVDVRARLYGYPLGNVLEWGRDRLAERAAKPSTMEERSAASGRFYQPPSGVARALRFGTAPFRVLQRPFPNRGTGLVAAARCAP